MAKRKVLTVITESVLEHALAEDIEKEGAHGYTITDARGKGNKGLRDAGWDYHANIRVEILCDDEVCNSLTKLLQEKYYESYAMVSFSYDVDVLRQHKF